MLISELFLSQGITYVFIALQVYAYECVTPLKWNFGAAYWN